MTRCQLCGRAVCLLEGPSGNNHPSNGHRWGRIATRIFSHMPQVIYSPGLGTVYTAEAAVESGDAELGRTQGPRNNNLYNCGAAFKQLSSCASIHRRSSYGLLSSRRPVETGRRMNPALQLFGLLLRDA